MVRKGILILLICVLAGSMTGASQAEDLKRKAFSDVKDSHWAKKDIYGAVGKGYVDGYPDDTFNPEGTITKAEFIKMVVAAQKYALASNGDSSAWYSSYWDTAKEQKLIVNNDLSEQEVNKPITRYEMARVAARAIGESTDEDKKWMYLATKSGLIHGLPGGELAQDETSTRAQAVAVIERILAVKAGEKLPVDKYAVSSAEIAWHKTNVMTMLPQYFATPYSNTSKFRTDLLRYDGDYGYSEVEKLIVVDMDDPKDPNRKLIPSDFRWAAHLGNNQIDDRSDTPKNSYALLSFNHIVTDSKLDVSPFQFSKLYINPFDKKADRNVDVNGNLIDIANYAKYQTHDFVSYGTYVLHAIPIKAGKSDIRNITGQLIPKIGLGKNGDHIAIYRDAAVQLGEMKVDVVYESKIDHSLSR
jgi:S-layer homology domain